MGDLNLANKIAEYIKTGGEDNYLLFKNKLIEEFNSLNIEGLPQISDLFALNGGF